jgi:exportin-1
VVLWYWSDIFDFSKDQMTMAKIKTMKESLTEEFSKIFRLCEYILAMSQRPSLIKVTLQVGGRSRHTVMGGFMLLWRPTRRVKSRRMTMNPR